MTAVGIFAVIGVVTVAALCMYAIIRIIEG